MSIKDLYAARRAWKAEFISFQAKCAFSAKEMLRFAEWLKSINATFITLAEFSYKFRSKTSLLYPFLLLCTSFFCSFIAFPNLVSMLFFCSQREILLT